MSTENVHNQVVWLDIPAVDLDRAIKFYSAVLGKEVKKEQFPGMTIGVLPHEHGNGGCVFVKDGEKPSATGPLVYLNAQGRLDDAIAAVTKLGGKILQPKHPIGPHGFRAVILDSEGNRMALHSM
ncbi:MAG TPA: VOC family protein [Tepidisphaeraceae bacterium]|jgi:predicted enzyme related to lactoylglutathione lyase